ncbi:class I SAM-dependent DNA methyltransferase [Pseudalkalibacillus sp. A8]|uniref:class I SAM-dependent DNA methyltransferase n=1 Tax=Pseudalkalibacillus sp. A8 TaxID=3382641 RepID=UPI0038B69EB9
MGGYSYYDKDDFFHRYQERRHRAESPNNVIGGPALMVLLGDVKGKDVLDLGCGDGQTGVELFAGGASSYHGIDGSEKMIELAEGNLKDTNALLEQMDLNNLKTGNKKYDLIISRFVFHYLADLFALFQKIHQMLRDDGKFVFSVQHPIITASMKSAEGKQRTDWIVDDYFAIGERHEPWINQTVTKYHLTIERYVQELLDAGFMLIDLKEGTPERHRFSTIEEYERRKRIPLSLILSAKKVPGTEIRP